MRCLSCSEEVPDGPYCARCGAAQLDRSVRPGRLNSAHYAADPDEHVIQPGIISTLFPHLGRNTMNEFRWAFVVGLLLLALLTVVGLVGAALLTAVFLIPALYLLYLFEVRVLRDAPASVLGMTFGAGLIVAIALEIAARLFGWRLGLDALSTSTDSSRFVLVAVALPILQELLKPLPPLILWRSGRFPHTVDGLVLGVAAGLGFSVGAALVRLGPVIPNLGLVGNSADWTWVLASTAVTAPLLHGSTTGAVVAGLWRIGHGARGRVEIVAVPLAIASHVAITAGTLMLAGAGFGPLSWLVWQGAIILALLVLIRVLLQRALIAEAVAEGFRRIECPNCGDAVTAAGFCPTCGVALGASSERGLATNPSPGHPTP